MAQADNWTNKSLNGVASWKYEFVAFCNKDAHAKRQGASLFNQLNAEIASARPVEEQNIRSNKSRKLSELPLNTSSARRSDRGGEENNQQK